MKQNESKFKIADIITCIKIINGIITNKNFAWINDKYDIKNSR